MIENIETYFLINKETPHKSTEENYQIRKAIACSQAREKPARLSQILDYVNEFLVCLEEINGGTCDTSQLNTLSLDWQEQIIINKCIIARGCKWVVPVWDENKQKYSVWEPKYNLIKNKFRLSHTKNLLWLKFTQRGHLGVVAKGMDINFDYNRTAGKLVTVISPYKILL